MKSINFPNINMNSITYFQLQHKYLKKVLFILIGILYLKKLGLITVVRSENTITISLTSTQQLLLTITIPTSTSKGNSIKGSVKQILNKFIRKINNGKVTIASTPNTNQICVYCKDCFNTGATICIP